jgi:hypothetical protein
MNTPSVDRGPHAGWYRIRIDGRLAARWATRFDGMTLSHGDDGTTLIQGLVVDQAALHGLLQQVRDTGLPLVSVTQVCLDQPGQPHISQPRSPRSTNEGDPR